jgi:hypothetical protein
MCSMQQEGELCRWESSHHSWAAMMRATPGAFQEFYR